MLIIIVMMIIISHSKQVLFIHVSQKCFSKFGNQDLLYLFIWGREVIAVGGTDKRTKGLEVGKHIYDSYLLKGQGSLIFKLKQREHITLKYFVLVKRNWIPFQVRLGSCAGNGFSGKTQPCHMGIVLEGERYFYNRELSCSNKTSHGRIVFSFFSLLYYESSEGNFCTAGDGKHLNNTYWAGSRNHPSQCLQSTDMDEEERVSWVFRHLPCCGECLGGKNQRNNTTPFKIQLAENRTQPHFSTNCAIQISRFHVPRERSRTYATTSLKILCQLPWPCCAPQHHCKGGLGLTKRQEIIASGKQFPSPLLPSPTTKKNLSFSSGPNRSTHLEKSSFKFEIVGPQWICSCVVNENTEAWQLYLASRAVLVATPQQQQWGGGKKPNNISRAFVAAARTAPPAALPVLILLSQLQILLVPLCLSDHSWRHNVYKMLNKLCIECSGQAPHGSWHGRLGVVWVQAAALDLFSPKSASKALWLGLTCSCVFVYLHEQRSGTPKRNVYMDSASPEKKNLNLFVSIKNKQKKSHSLCGFFPVHREKVALLEKSEEIMGKIKLIKKKKKKQNSMMLRSCARAVCVCICGGRLQPCSTLLERVEIFFQYIKKKKLKKKKKTNSGKIMLRD
ncbi:hypothetical protein EK904_005432 [Melospiza melodia maxima]|nr:hypothetical protein EK904_005432 [Melospiza melodia maxima]